VTANGVVYVNTWSGRYYHDDTPPPGGFLIALQDTKGGGRADNIVRFGPTKADGNAGGTGVALYQGYLYAETNDRIVRYQLPANGIEPTAAPETVVSGLPLTGDHPMHPIAIDPQGNLYVDLGSATNSCQSQNRQPNVPGNLHRVGDPSRHLALRRQSAGSAFLASRALCYGSPQRQGDLF
jgi:glucose/arabinose dehydrogenase